MESSTDYTTKATKVGAIICFKLVRFLKVKSIEYFLGLLVRKRQPDFGKRVKFTHPSVAYLL